MCRNLSLRTGVILLLGLCAGVGAHAADVVRIYLYPTAKPNQAYHLICVFPGSTSMPPVNVPGAFYPTIEVSNGARTLVYTVGGLYGRQIKRPLTTEECAAQSD